jgi:hypothetical protein
MVFYFLLFILTQSAIYDNTSFTLGSNLIVNPEFVLPDLMGASYQAYTNVPGWTCVPSCQLVNVTRMCQNFIRPCETNYSKAVDLDSMLRFDELRHTVSITNQSIYLLTVIWLAPINNPIGKQFHITVNNTRLQNITCDASNSDYKFQKVEMLLDLGVGDTELFF